MISKKRSLNFTNNFKIKKKMYHTEKQFEQLPTDLLIYDILPKTPLPALLRLCQTDKNINQLCRNEKMWQLKLQYDFPNIIPTNVNNWRDFYFQVESSVYTDFPDAPPKPINISWRQYHRLLRCSYIYPVNYRGNTIPYPGKHIGFLFIIPTITTFRSLITSIETLLSNNKVDIKHYFIDFINQISTIYIDGQLYSGVDSDQFQQQIDFGTEYPILIRPLHVEFTRSLVLNQVPFNLNTIIVPKCLQISLNNKNSRLNAKNLS